MNINPKELKENSYSRKLFPELQGIPYELLKKDIQERGIQTPLVITKDNLILCGHERRRVALELGLETVPITYFNGSETEQDIFLILENIARKSVDFFTKYRCFGELKRLYGLNIGVNKRYADTALAGTVVMTEEQIAKETGISEDTFERTMLIQKSELPQVLKNIAYEGQSIRTIAELTKQPKEVQQKIADKVDEGLTLVKAIKKVVAEQNDTECGIPPTFDNEEDTIILGGEKVIKIPKCATYPNCCPSCVFYEPCVNEKKGR